MKNKERRPRPSRRKPPTAPQKILHGVGVNPGVAIGVACLRDAREIQAFEHCVLPSKIADEKKRFALAVSTALRQISFLRGRTVRMPGQAGEELGYLLDAYAQMLKGSRLLRGVEARIEAEGINAEAAVRKEIDTLLEAFAAIGDSYLAGRMEDIREVGNRLVRNLTRTHARRPKRTPRNSVLIGADLTPADVIMLNAASTSGVAAESGSTQSHAAIMARSLNLTAVLGVSGLRHAVHPGDVLILDGKDGLVIVNPHPETLAAYRQKRADFLRARRALTALRDVPAVTVDGCRIALLANIELPAEASLIKASGAEGIGLLRSEFLFMNRRDWPTEDEQTDVLKAIAASSEHPVTVRLLDVGGDKMPAVSTSSGPGSPGSILGLRGIRFLLSERGLMETQMTAILRAAADAPLRILVPMATSPEELIEVRAVLERIHRRLKRRKTPAPSKPPPLGAMIEVPAAAVAAEALAEVCDFFSIGSNDLTQYTLAVNRTDPAAAPYYNPAHPAVLRLIKFATEAALRQGIPVGVCGEIAGDARMTALLLGFGIRELSMAAGSIPLVKRRIRKLSLFEAEQHARSVMRETIAQRILERLPP